MSVSITGKAAEEARRRAAALGLDPVEYLERLVSAEAEQGEQVDELLAEAAREPDEAWDIELIRREGRALADHLRRQ